MAGFLAAEAGAGGGGVDFRGDGLHLSPMEYTGLLSSLAAKGGCAPDSYSRGGVVEQLEARFATLLGKEAAVWCPTGTLANHLAVRLLAGSKRRVLVQAESHLYNDEGDCAQALSGLMLVPLAPGGATFSAAEVRAQVERAAESRVAVTVGAISIESPVRRRSGEVFDYQAMQEISAYARSNGIGLHLDGARVFLASAYTGISPRQYASLFDTVYVSLYKYFNAASGAILAGPRGLLENLYHTRRMFGGGMNQVWPNAAVALHFLDGFEERYARAVKLSEQLYARLGGRLERVRNGTNISWWKAGEEERRLLAGKGIAVAEPRGGKIALTVNESILRKPLESLAAAFPQG